MRRVLALWRRWRRFVVVAAVLALTPLAALGSAIVYNFSPAKFDVWLCVDPPCLGVALDDERALYLHLTQASVDQSTDCISEQLDTDNRFEGHFEGPLGSTALPYVNEVPFTSPIRDDVKVTTYIEFHASLHNILQYADFWFCLALIASSLRFVFNFRDAWYATQETYFDNCRELTGWPADSPEPPPHLSAWLHPRKLLIEPAFAWLQAITGSESILRHFRRV